MTRWESPEQIDTAIHRLVGLQPTGPGFRRIVGHRSGVLSGRASPVVGSGCECVGVSIRALLEEPPVRPEVWPTGFSTLDAMRGGLARGELWVITGPPACGKTVLLTQLAYSLAVEHEFLVEYHGSVRDARALTRSRFLSLAVRRAPTLPSHEVSIDGLPDQRVAALEALKSAQLDIYLGGGFRIPPWDDARSAQQCLVVDDADGGRAPSLNRHARAGLRGLADRGAIVLVTVPRSHCFTPNRSDSLREEWSAVADVIIDISSNDAGSSTLHLRQNRGGPERDVEVFARWHFARMDETTAS